MIKDLENEVWKDIPGYEGLYQVSNKGRVKSLARLFKNGINSYFKSKDKILKPSNNGNGYLIVSLSKDSNSKMKTVHRLVAETFIYNPQNLPCVNHKDENKQNNCLENLEFCTVSYNNNYGTHKERITKTVQEKTGKKIKSLDIKTNKITIYPSINEAERQLNISHEAISYNINKAKSPYKKRYIFSKV